MHNYLKAKNSHQTIYKKSNQQFVVHLVSYVFVACSFGLSASFEFTFMGLQQNYSPGTNRIKPKSLINLLEFVVYLT